MSSVDIVIRTKDRPALFLARALDDVLAQEFVDWHLFVVQDGSDPEPARALLAERTFGDKATLIALPEPAGIAGAANRGIEQGRSDFIAIHDDDDTWHPRFLQRTVEHLQTTDDLAVATRIEILWEEQLGNRFIVTDRELFHGRMLEVTYFDLLRFNHVVPIGLLFRRSAWEDLGPLDEQRDVIDDWIFNMQVAATGRFGLIDEVLAYWHQRRKATGPSGNTVVAALDRHRRDDRRVRDAALRAYVKQHGPGALLYLAKYIDERFQELHHRLDSVEADQQELLRALRARADETNLPDRIRRRLKGFRS